MVLFREKIHTTKIKIYILFVLLLLPAFYAMGVAIDLEYSWLKKIAYLSVVLVLLFIPALFLKAKTYFLIEGIFNFFFFPIEMASLYLNKQSVSVAFLQNLFHTDWHESTELLMSLWPLCCIVIALWGFFFILATRLDNVYLFNRRISKFIIIVGCILLVSGICTLGIMQKIVTPSKPTKQVVIDSFCYTWTKLYKIYPYNLYINTCDIIKSQHMQRHMQREADNFHFGIQSLATNENTLFIFVIGEASRYDHWSINGYHRPTTPLLTKQTNIINYDSVFSQANLTRYSVPLILTRATAQHPEKAYQEKSLSEAFQEAGYKIGFLSMQPPSNLTTRIMHASDYSFYNAHSFATNDNYDMDLLQPLRTYIADSMQMFILHTLGSHYRYEQRYPPEFAIYQPVMGNTFSKLNIIEQNKDLFINAYDNSILYTDYFLNELITYVDSLDKEAVILYMSDHGESLWDDERKLSLHGSYQITKYEYHVPFVIWYSNEYAAQHPEKISVMVQNKTTPVSSDVVFYSLLDMAGIDDIVDSTRSICSTSLARMDTIWVHTGSGSSEKWGIPRPPTPLSTSETPHGSLGD